MQELSLNILDVAYNCVRAKASKVVIEITENTAENLLSIMIDDNGSGMDEAQLDKVRDPFYTTRTTRKVGLGVPLFEMSAVMCGGSFEISSTPGIGTKVFATYPLDSIDRMPLGDIASTYVTLVASSSEIDFSYTHTVDGCSFCADTVQFKEILGDIALDNPQVTAFIKDYITENLLELDAKA